MAKKKAAKKNEEVCPACGKEAKSLTMFADGMFKAVHSFKMAKVRSAATGKMIECQVVDRVCTNDPDAVVEEDFA